MRLFSLLVFAMTTGMCCIDRYGFVPLTDMAPQADADKGNAVADGASQDCRINQENRYEYISARTFSTPAGVLSHLGQRHIIISQRLIV